MAIAFGRHMKLVDRSLMTKLREDPGRVPKDWAEPRKPNSPDTVYISRELVADGNGALTIHGLWYDGVDWRKIDYLGIFADSALTEPPVPAPVTAVTTAKVDPAHAEPEKKGKKGKIIISLEAPKAEKENPAPAGAPA